MIDVRMRATFGIITFTVVGLIVALVLSPFVPADKEAISNVILGNALGWPAIILAYYFGSSSGSKEKTELMAARPDGTPDDPVFVEEEIE